MKGGRSKIRASYITEIRGGGREGVRIARRGIMERSIGSICETVMNKLLNAHVCTHSDGTEKPGRQTGGQACGRMDIA